MAQITFAKASLENLIEKMKNDYDARKGKEEKKLLLQQIENIEHDTQFTEVLKNATEFHLMLSTRVTEADSYRKRLARRLGFNIYAEEPRTNHLSGVNRADTDNFIDAEDSGMRPSSPSAANAPHTANRVNSDEMRVQYSTIPPPRINLPKFYGNEAEWPEFWAIYETLVHKNHTLSVIEKMILLKDSLRGKSDRAVKGIQLVPDNYDWMIQALTKKYGNKPANRARIVQQLKALRQADENARSNESSSLAVPFNPECSGKTQAGPGKTFVLEMLWQQPCEQRV
ncbi:unnamed protein product [Nippostrongylus brasiliensis]|uniref:Uncharacterized protein n=1 Tax=Nippostrongylus brasiliensis TaxID=27835 RepID=A0A0N4Y9G7_NIPBR|nr:unnamed protein product [Nippostrongylus brasiliensis]